MLIRYSVVAALLAATAHAQTLPAPLPLRNVADTYYGTTVDDPYRYVENLADPEVQAWMKAQADYTQALLAKLPGRARLLARIEEIDAARPAVVSSVRWLPSGRVFYLKRQADESQLKLYTRDSLVGAETLLVDPEEAMKVTGKAHAIGSYGPSPDGRLVAYTISPSGTEEGVLRVIDTATRKDAITPIDRIRFPALNWLEDGSGFFYQRLQEMKPGMTRTDRYQNRRTYFHRLVGDGATPDPAVFGPGVIAAVPIAPTSSGSIITPPESDVALGLVTHGVRRELTLWVAPRDRLLKSPADVPWAKVFDVDDKITGFTYARGYLYLKTYDGAPRFKVLRLRVEAKALPPKLAAAQTVIPASEAVVVDIAAARDALYLTQREGTLTRLTRVPHSTPIRPEIVTLPYAGYVELASVDTQRNGALLQLGTWTRAAQYYSYSPAGREIVAVGLQPQGKFDAPDTIESREAMVKSHDDVAIPVSILSAKNIKLDGRNPTILYGYGAYGITEDPAWNARLLAWLERGGVFVFAHVRGGGIYGDAWYRAGFKTTKPNTWKDGIAVAEWLIAQGYATRDRLGIYGGSAGGIFVGRAITERPELFAAAVPVVGVFDMVQIEQTANGVGNIPEFGTVKDEAEFRALLAMSAYYQVKNGTAYPAVMLIHGVNDTRVDVWQSMKMAARLQAATTSGKPVLLRLDYDAGHGIGSTREQLQTRTADTWAFLLWQFGAADFQP